MVSARTRDRIVAAAGWLGYRPGMIGGVEARTVGLLVADITNPSVAPVVRGIEDTLDGHGMIPTLAETQDRQARVRRVFEHFVRRRVDAVITTATRSGDRALIEDIARRVPTVLAVRPLAGSGLTTLTGDDRAGAGLVVRHFAGLGHRRVAQLVGPRDVANFALRGDGFTASAQRAGLRMLEIPEAAGAATVAEGRRLMISLLQRHPHPPTAVFAHSDTMAFGALAALRTYGVACPDDLSLVGYGDAPAAALTSPALTTVRIPGYELGCRAAEAAVSLLASPSSSPVRVSLRPVLVHRGSSAAPPRHLDGVWR